MRLSPEFELLSKDTGRLKMKVPIWFKANHYNSIAKWIVLFLERAIWIHYHTFVKQSKFSATQLQDIKPMWLQPDNKLIQFRNEILPYWTELMQKIKKDPIDTVQDLYKELDKQARQNITVSDVDILTGGINFAAYDLKSTLHDFNKRLLTLTQISDNTHSQFQFIQNLALIKPANMHLSLDIKLEFMLARILLEKQIEDNYSSSQNKK